MSDIYSSTLLLGGKGMLAYAICAQLQSRRHTCVPIDLPDYDLTKESDVRRLFATYRPTLVINTAAHTKVDLCEQEEEKANAINGYAVGHVASAAKEYSTKLLHISTDFVFDGRGTRPYLTTDVPNPLSAYGRSKLLGEQQLQGVDPPDWLIVRPAWLYGPRGPNFPRTMVERARAGQPLKVVADQFGCPTYTFDLADALLDLVDRNAQGIYHVTNSEPTNWYEFAKVTLEEFGLRTDLSPISTVDYQQMRPQSAPRPSYSVLDLTDFQRTVGHSMRPWREALHDFHVTVTNAGAF